MPRVTHKRSYLSVDGGDYRPLLAGVAVCPVHTVELEDGECIPCSFGFPAEGEKHDPKLCVNGLDGLCDEPECKSKPAVTYLGAIPVPPPECSVCRRPHGDEIQHGSE